MSKIQQFKISTSLTDFLPIIGTLEPLFKGIKQAGVDNVEMVIGLKSRWSARYLRNLSEKYELPIATVHQPIWSGLGFYVDNNFAKLAKELGATDIVFHVLPFFSYKSNFMKDYFKKLAFIQKTFGITVMLENPPELWGLKMFNKRYPALEEGLHNMENLYKVAEEYNFKITYDISHGRFPRPHQEKWFEKVFPKIHNIHVSSFDDKKEHLPLNMGNFRAHEFVSYLYERRYKGHLTFEIFYPRFISLRTYNFSYIQRSVEIIKSIQFER